MRWRFSMEYKAKILAEADACTESGMLGELLRREGLYSSHLSTWRSLAAWPIQDGFVMVGGGDAINRWTGETPLCPTTPNC